MQHFSASLRELVVGRWRNRNLINASIQREMLARYRGSVFGGLWSVFSRYSTLVFNEILKARWTTGSSSNAEFAFILFAGVMPFSLFAETLTQSPRLVVGISSYLKKVVYLLEIA